MLEVAYHLKSFRFGEGLVDINELPDLYDRLASILARRVLDRVRKGLHRAYVAHTEALSYVRGRLDMCSSVRLLASATPSIQCEFHEHTADIEDNQILAWTLHVLCKTALKREGVKSLVRSAYRAIEGATRLRAVEPSECRRRLYNRLNQDYEPVHALCRFFLEGLGPGVDRGVHEVMPFTVDMARLFESFVAGWLKLNAPKPYEFAIQHKLSLIGTDVIDWTVDILVQDATGGAVAVLDTKYKRNRDSAAADIQQVVAYAVESRVTNAFLVYPTPIVPPMKVRVGDVTVRSAHFDLGCELNASGQSLLAQLNLL
jgi:5-methylcytosine-specific restriction enzyme subunit McrC